MSACISNQTPSKELPPVPNGHGDGEHEESIHNLLAKLLRGQEELKTEVHELRSEVTALRQQLKDQLSNPNGDGDESPAALPPDFLLSCRRGSQMLRRDVDTEHKKLIDILKEEGFIQSDKVYQVMLSVNFMHFSRDGSTPKKSFQINKAKFFEQYVKRVKEGSRVLYMFSNPYVAVCLALIVGPSGFVVTEGDSGTQSDVKKHYSFLVNSGRLMIVDGKWCDFFSRGYDQKAPYDVIIVPKQYYSGTVAKQLDPESGMAYDPWDDTRLD